MRHIARPSADRLLMAMAILCLAAGAGAVPADVNSTVEGECLIADHPTDPQAYVTYAKWLSSQRDHQEAARVLETGRTKAQPSPDLLVALGQVYVARELVSRAEAVTREALVLDPDHLEANLRLGEIYFDLGWPRSALDCFERAVILAPDEVEPRVKLVGGLLAGNRLQEAEDRCVEFVSANPEEADLWLCLGRVFEVQGKHREAFTTYGQVLTVDPESAEAYGRQGRLFCQFGQFQAAAAACRQALALEPDLALAHAYLGIACSRLGDEDGAREHAQIAEAAGLNMMSVWKKIGR